MTKGKSPIACCPGCGRTVLYSDGPNNQLSTIVRVADETYHGKTVLCAKCQSILAVIENPKIARGYHTIPIISRIG